MGCGAQMVGRVAAEGETGARLGIVRQQNPRGCVRRGRIDPPLDTGRGSLASQLGWIALALLAAGLAALAVS